MFRYRVSMEKDAESLGENVKLDCTLQSGDFDCTRMENECCAIGM